MRAAVLERPELPPLGLKPPRKAKVVGVFQEEGSVHNDKIIYSEVVLDREATLATKKIRTDPVTGLEVWKKAPGGDPLYPIMVVKEIFKTVEFVLLEVPARHVKRVFNFRMSDAERNEINLRKAEQDFFRSFVTEAAKAGLSPAEVVRRMKADISPGKEDAVELSVTEEVIQQTMDSLSDEEIEQGGVLTVERDDLDVVEEGTQLAGLPEAASAKPKPTRAQHKRRSTKADLDD